MNEQGLAIPRQAKVIFYPVPFCPADEDYSTLLHWVQSGGVLYLSGDLSYDDLRRRSRTGRLEELCGVRFLSERYPNIAVNPTNSLDQPCIRVEPAGAPVMAQSVDGSPLVLENRVGQGRVLFTIDPIELHSTDLRRGHDLALYRRVLESAGSKPLRLEPDDPRLHAFRIPLRDKSDVYILFNTDESQPTRTVTLAETRDPVTVTLARRRPGLVWIDRTGALRSVETQGRCSVGQSHVLTDETAGTLLALDAQDLLHSRALVLMPLQAGQVSWSTTTGWTDPIVETGDIEQGRWQTLAQESVRPAESACRVQVSKDQALSLLLVCEKPELPRWRQALERAMTDPGSLP